jgi:hypothetical protein
MTPRARRTTLSAANSGWVRVSIDDDRPFDVRVRLNERGRLEIVELWLAPGGPIDSTTLRQVQLVHVEGLVNAPDLREYIIARLDEPEGAGFDRTDQIVEGGALVAHAGTAGESGAALPPQVVRGGSAHGTQRIGGTAAGRRGRFFEIPPADEGRRIEVELTDRVTISDSLTVTRKGRPRAKLRVPSTNPKPPKFYKEVARAYLELAAESHRPVVELAEANTVPWSTAQRWVKEARRRGFLPPGQKGRRG